MEEDSRNWPRQIAAKKGEVERMSSWAAKRRCSEPTQSVMMGEVRLLVGEIDQWAGRPCCSK